MSSPVFWRGVMLVGIVCLCCSLPDHVPGDGGGDDAMTSAGFLGSGQEARSEEALPVR